MKKSPLPNYHKIYLIWTGLAIFIVVVLPPLLDATHPGGAQMGMTSLTYSLPVFVIGYALISIFMLLIRGPKNRDYILANGFVLASVFWLCGKVLLSNLDERYTISRVRYEGHDEVKTERDYYRYGHQLKAIRHFRNLYPDSIWEEYDRIGNITKRQAGESIIDNGIHE